MNVYLRYEDNLYTAECKRALATSEAQGNQPYKSVDPVEIWTEEKAGGALFARCTDVFKTGDNNFQ